MRLTVLTGDRPDDPLHFVLTEADKPVDGGEAASLAALSERLSEKAAPEHVAVILPGERFAVRRLTTPARNTRQLMQAARFLLEDELAGPVDAMHVAIAETVPDQGAPDAEDPAGTRTGRPVIAVERDWLAGWVAALRGAGLSPDLLTCDLLALGIEGQAVMLVEQDRLTLNLFGEGFVAERPLADDLARDLLTGSSARGVGIISVGNIDLPRLPDGLKSEGAPLRDRNNLAFFLAGHVAHNRPVDLLQGEFERGVDWREAIAPWRLAGVLAAACLVFYLALVGAEAYSLHRAADGLEAQAASRFVQAYPELPQRNIRGQARQIAAAGGGGEAQFLRLSGQLARVVEAHDDVQLAALSYDTADGLVADIRLVDPRVMEDLKAALAGQGITVQEGRNLSSDSGNAFIGKLYLKVAS